MPGTELSSLPHELISVVILRGAGGKALRVQRYDNPLTARGIPPVVPGRLGELSWMTAL